MRKGSVLGIVLMLVAVLSASVAAADLTDWGKAVKQKLGGTEITVAMATHPSTEAFQKMTPEFEKLTGIKVKWDVMEEIYLHDKLLTEHAAGTGRYDVLMMDVTWIGEFAKKRVVEPLDKYLADKGATPAWYDYADFVPAYSRGLGMFEGKVYGLPSAGESAFLAYRKDLFEKFGYSASKIKTVDDLMAAAKFFAGKEPGLYGISMRGRRGHHIDYGWFQFLYPFGGGVVDPKTNEPLINSAASVKSLEYFVNLMKYAPPGIENFSHEEATTTFMQGKAAIWFDATALAPWIEDAARSKVAGKVGYLPPVSGPAGSAACVAGWNLAVSTKTKKDEAAWAFIVYMTSKANAVDYVNHGGVVTRTSVLTSPEFVKRYPYYPEILASLDLADKLIDKGIDWRPRLPEWPKMGEIIGLKASLALTGQLSPKQAADEAAKEVHAVLDSKGYYK